MEKVTCRHGTPCVLKTGLTNRETHGHSFYMCPHRKANCGFVQEVSIPLLECPVHNMPVGLRAWNRDNPNTISFFCSERPQGSQWCGSMPAQDEKENVKPRAPRVAELKKAEGLPGTPGEPAAGGGRTPLAPLDGPSGSSGRKQTPGLLQEGSFHLSLDESDNSVLTASRDVSVASEYYSAAEKSCILLDSDTNDEQDRGESAEEGSPGSTADGSTFSLQEASDASQDLLPDSLISETPDEAETSEMPDGAEGSLTSGEDSRLSWCQLDDSRASTEDTPTSSCQGSPQSSCGASLSESSSVSRGVSRVSDEEGESTTEGEVELMRTSHEASPSPHHASPSLHHASPSPHHASPSPHYVSPSLHQASLREELDQLSFADRERESVLEIDSSLESSTDGSSASLQPSADAGDETSLQQSDHLPHSSLSVHPLRQMDNSAASKDLEEDSASSAESESESKLESDPDFDPDTSSLPSMNWETSLNDSTPVRSNPESESESDPVSNPESESESESKLESAPDFDPDTSSLPSVNWEASMNDSTPVRSNPESESESDPVSNPESESDESDPRSNPESESETDLDPDTSSLPSETSLNDSQAQTRSYTCPTGPSPVPPSPPVPVSAPSVRPTVICLDTPDNKPSEVVSVDEPDYQQPAPIVVEEGEEGEEEEEGCGREPEFKVAHQYRTLVKQYQQMEHLIRTIGHNLPDKGALLVAQKKAILERMAKLKRPVPPVGGVEGKGQGEGGGGPKFHLTHQAKMLTAGAVEHLHCSLASCPTEETLAEDPPGLTVSLMVHQRRALAWLQWRESQTPSGGILADDMGLGKTLSMLSLVLDGRVRERQGEGSEWVGRTSSDGLVRSVGTLVVCPASLMLQWEKEVCDRVERGRLRVRVYHGPNRTKSAVELSNYDVVMTTYNIVNVEGATCEDEDPTPGVPRKPRRRMAASTTLFQVHWRRVVLDEAHVIRNPKSGTAIGVCRLKSDHRWAVTGTPIQNNLKDFYSLIKFIRLAPFDDFRVWKDTVEKRGSLGMQRLNTMVSSLVLRRTKAEMSSELLKLTRREVETHTLQLSQEEQEVYSVLFAKAKTVFREYLREQEGERVNEQEHLSQKAPPSPPSAPPDIERVVSSIFRPLEGCTMLARSKGRCVLALLLRLRQCCSHLHLLTSALERGEGDQDQVDLQLAMGALSLQEEGGGVSAAGGAAIPERFRQERASTKIKEVLQQLLVIDRTKDSPPQKSIIVSQWTSMLNMMQHHLDRAGISHVRIDGAVPPKLRTAIVTKFNAPSKSPSVMLLSLQAGGVGLNLMGANHVFILDMHWNPALEEQAADRCHRVGQTRDVHIHRFVCSGTVEEKILQLQNKKLQLSRDVLSGASRHTRNQNRLSLTDLKHLFEIN